VDEERGKTEQDGRAEALRDVLFLLVNTRLRAAYATPRPARIARRSGAVVPPHIPMTSSSARAKSRHS
jgi:hypothetical protein